MVGIAVVAAETTRAPDHRAEMSGVGVDLACWHGRFGLAGEASMRWTLDSDGSRATVLGGSARFRLLERMLPSLLDPRDVELGLEVQAIIERTWWSDQLSTTSPTSYGFGLALRVRGGRDPDGSTGLAESRFFLRVMSSRYDASNPPTSYTPMTETLSRMIEPVARPDRAFTVLLGIGASFGGGTRAYSQRFRMHPFDVALPW